MGTRRAGVALASWAAVVSSRCVATLVGGALTACVWACGSGDTSNMPSYAGGGPAHAEPTRDAGGGSSSGGSGGSGSSGSSSGSENPNQTGGDGGAPGFGNVIVASFTLINANLTFEPAGTPVPGYDPIAYGATIDVGHVGEALNIRANPPPVSQIGSVAFALDATYTYKSNTSPYALCGDDGKGKFLPCMFSEGKHVMTVTMYPETDLNGTPYQPTTFEFTIVNSAADAGTD
jgi:hypothetical protein